MSQGQEWIFAGKVWRLECRGCGAPLVPRFALEESGGQRRAMCPQLGCGAGTRVALVGDTLVPEPLLDEYRRSQGPEG